MNKGCDSDRRSISHLPRVSSVVTFRVECEVILAAGEADLTLIDALARMQCIARAAGGVLVLRRGCPDVERLLELTGLDGVVLKDESAPEDER